MPPSPFLQTSLTSVDELIKKHEAFEKTLEAQEEKITTLKQLADALLAQEHYASTEIETRCTGVIGRRDRVKGCAVQRREKLIDSLNYQQFLANVHEVGYLASLFSPFIAVAGSRSCRDLSIFPCR